MTKYTIEIETSEDVGQVLAALNREHLGARLVSAAASLKPIKLLPYQQAWVDDRSRFKVWDCDRRLGATTAVIAEALAVADDPAGGSVIIVGPSFRDIAEMSIDAEQRGHKVKRWERFFEITSTRRRVVLAWGSIFPRRTFPKAEVEHLLSCNIPWGEPLSPALVVFDNVENVHNLNPESVMADFWGAKRLAVVATGARAQAWSGWDGFIARPTHGADVHITTARDAIEQGLGRKWCEVNDREWSHEWEAQWIEGIRASDPNGLEWRL